MLHRLIARMEGLWRQVQRAGLDQRTVLAVTRNQRLFTDLRVLAIQQGWSIRFAGATAQALECRPRTGICVLLYDRDLAGGDWARDVKLLSTSENPVMCIVLSDSPGASLRAAVVRCGGFDVARKPLDHGHLAGLINGALALAEEIESCQAPVHA